MRVYQFRHSGDEIDYMYKVPKLQAFSLFILIVLDFWAIVCYTMRMFKMNKKSIILSLLIIAILVAGFVAFMPDTASAEGGRNYHYGPTEDTDYRAPRVSASASGGLEGGRNMSVNYTFPVEPSYQTPVTYRNTSTRVETEPVEGEDEGDEFSALAANALFGGSSFMPSGITQWILFIIFILLLVIVVRRILGKDKEYLTAPLKHD